MGQKSIVSLFYVLFALMMQSDGLAVEPDRSPFVPEHFVLVHNDEFVDSELDTDLWFLYRLPHWSDSGHLPGSKAGYDLSNGVLSLSTRFQPVGWSPWVHDGNQVSSGIATGQVSGGANTRDGLHIPGTCQADPSTCPVFSSFSDMYQRQAIFKYGYFEIRAKFPTSSRATWWMVGFPDGEFEKLGEIDILEFNNAQPEPFSGKCVHFGIHPHDDSALSREGHFFGEDCSEFNQDWLTFGFFWTEEGISLEIHRDSGSLVGSWTIDQSPGYEMVTFFTTARWQYDGEATLDLDYFRVYQDSRIYGTDATMLNGVPGWGKNVENAIDNDYSTHTISTSSFWDLEIDLNSLYRIEEIIFTPHPGNWATDYSVQLQDGAGNWFTAETIAGAENLPQVFLFDPPILGQKVLFDVTGESQTDPYGHAVKEVEVFGRLSMVEVPNMNALMLNGSPGWGKAVENTVDGDFSTHAISTSSFWDLEIDLAQSYRIDHIVFTPHPNNWATDFLLMVKTENGVWTTVRRVEDAGNSPQTFSFLSPVEARFVRIDVTGESQSASYGHAVREVQVFGFPIP